MPAVLLAVLEALLSRFQDGSTDILPSSGLVLARCLIRLTVQQLERAHTDQLRPSDRPASRDTCR